MSQLEILISLYPDKSWNWNYLSKNPKISWEFIKNNRELNWDWKSVCMNPNISFDIIFSHPEYKWDWAILSWREDLTLSIIKNHLDINWDFNAISGVKDIEIDFVFKHIDKNWNWYSISREVSIKDFENYTSISWNSDGLSNNNNITPDIVDRHPEISWNYFLLSSNHNFTIDYIYKNKEKDWNWKCISRIINFDDYLKYKNLLPFQWSLVHNENIPIDYIIPNMPNHTTKKFLYSSFYQRRKFTLEQVVKIEETDDFGNLSNNESLDWTILLNLKYKNSKTLISNPRLTMDIIEKYFPFYINYTYLSMNPSLTWQMVVKNIDKNWCWQSMSLNRFDGEKDNSLNRYFSRILKKDERLYTDLINFFIEF
jgi:hypothetical protein